MNEKLHYFNSLTANRKRNIVMLFSPKCFKCLKQSIFKSIIYLFYYAQEYIHLQNKVTKLFFYNLIEFFVILSLCIDLHV